MSAIEHGTVNGNPFASNNRMHADKTTKAKPSRVLFASFHVYAELED